MINSITLNLIQKYLLVIKVGFCGIWRATFTRINANQTGVQAGQRSQEDQHLKLEHFLTVERME